MTGREGAERKDAKTGRRGHTGPKDAATRRRGDAETSVSPRPRVSPSPRRLSPPGVGSLHLRRRLLGTVAGLARVLPLRLAQRCGAWIGDLLFLGVRRYREVALRNLGLAFGWEEEQARPVARQAFRNIGKTLVEFLRQPHTPPAEVRRRFRLDNMEPLHQALAAGRGALLITGHYGNWELFAARLVAEGVPVNVVARDADDAALNEFINGIRERSGYRVISRRLAARGVLEALRRNEAVAILMDQNTVKGGAFVPFFGRLASTVTGPASFALRTGATVLVGFAVRQPDDTHVGLVLPPVTLPRTGDREADVRELTARLTARIEDQIRADPTQWFWIHDRWRHRPMEERAGQQGCNPREPEDGVRHT